MGPAVIRCGAHILALLRMNHNNFKSSFTFYSIIISSKYILIL